MTQNQIAYAKAVEEERHNRANENLDLYKTKSDLSYKVWEQLRKEAAQAGSDVNKSFGLSRVAAQGRRVSALAQSNAQMGTMHALDSAWYPKLNERNNEYATVTQVARRSGSNTSNAKIGGTYYD